MNVPFLDLTAQYNSIKSEIDHAIGEVINKNAFIGSGGNPFVLSFENNFANYIGTKHCIGCANGTDAIEISLRALGIKYGDEVIVPANSWISTSEAVSAVGGIPVFIDTDPRLFTIDLSKIREKISEKTKVIIPVHLYGLPVDMHEIVKIANEYNLKIIEDCAQAHGAKIHGKTVGTFGDTATFSFYPGKNLGAYGDAGAILTNNDSIAEKLKMIRNHGQLKKHAHKIEGRNSRLDGIQAAVLNVKLQYIKEWNKLRNKAAQKYSKLINISEVSVPIVPENYYHVYHLYVIIAERRDKLINYLNKNNVQTAIHYPTPLPLLEAYKRFNFSEKDFPSAFGNKDKILSLPIFPEISVDKIEYVVDKLNSFYS